MKSFGERSTCLSEMSKKAAYPSEKMNPVKAPIKDPQIVP